MSINLSYYDLTQLDYVNDANNDGAIPQAATLANQWVSLISAFKRASFRSRENRIKHRGNLQTLSIDKQVKKWLEWELELLALKFEGGTPDFDIWDIVNKSFYGGATGAPVTRPGNIFLGAKLNRTTPEYWTAFGCKAEEFVLRGNMVQDHLSMTLRGVARGFVFNTTNYIQGTSTRRAEPVKTPIVPAQDVTVTVDGADQTDLIQEFTLTLRRVYERHGRANTVVGSSSQVAIDGKNYREFVPNTFEGRLALVIDPFGTTSERLIDYINDIAQGTYEIKTSGATGAKQIQFTASKTQDAPQENVEGQSPSIVNLDIEGSTFNVATVA